MASAPKVATPRRGDIYLVGFDPSVGAEIRKTRPALVLQNDTANRFSPITIVAAVTSQYGPSLYPSEVLLSAPEGGLEVDSVVLLNQIRSIDRRRLMRRVGRLRAETMRQIDQALAVSLGLVDLS